MMYLTLSRLLIIAFFSLFSTLRSEEWVQKTLVPTVEEMQDPSAPWGLNLQRVLARQTRLRNAGVTRDLSFCVSWLQEIKKKHQDTLHERENLLRKLQEERLYQENVPHPTFIQKLKELFIKATSHDIISLQKQLSAIDKKILHYTKTQEALEQRIAQDFHLQLSQVQRLPPLAPSRTSCCQDIVHMRLGT